MPLPEPDALCTDPDLTDRAAVERHLLARFVPAAYRPAAPGTPQPWTADEAERTLRFLARHLDRELAGTPDLAWWQLSRSLPRRPLSAVIWMFLLMSLVVPIVGTAGLLAGLVYGLVRVAAGGPWSQLAFGVTAGATGGVVGGGVFAIASGAVTVGKAFLLDLLDRRRWEWPPIHHLRWDWNGQAPLGLMGGIILGVGVAFVFGEKPGFVVGASVAIAGVIWGGLTFYVVDVTTAEGPAALMAHERRSVITAAATVSVVGAVLAAVVLAIADVAGGGLETGAIDGAVAGFAVGASVGLTSDAAQSAWLGFTATRWYLALRHGLPRDLMAFLVDAHQHRGVLRQLAGVYQFRHVDLQRSLAD